MITQIIGSDDSLLYRASRPKLELGVIGHRSGLDSQWHFVRRTQDIVTFLLTWYFNTNNCESELLRKNNARLLQQVESIVIPVVAKSTPRA